MNNQAATMSAPTVTPPTSPIEDAGFHPGWKWTNCAFFITFNALWVIFKPTFTAHSKFFPANLSTAYSNTPMYSTTRSLHLSQPPTTTFLNTQPSKPQKWSTASRTVSTTTPGRLTSTTSRSPCAWGSTHYSSRFHQNQI